MGTGAPKKYDPIWKKLVAQGVCKIACTPEDVLTVTNGVKKHKVKVTKKEKKNGKVLKIKTIPTKDPNKVEIEFRLVEDTSIRNL